MEKLKFTLLSIVILAIIGLIGYWAVMSLQSGSEYLATQQIGQLKQENGDLQNEVKDLTSELSDLKSQTTTPTQSTTAQTPQTPTQPASQTTTYKYQSTITQLQALISANVLMKLKSQGTRVGTVQTFLNIYNNTSNKVDNDYGASTEAGVKAFQKDQGLTADGQAGAGTFQKMIDWLKKQG
jgi:peptidoglycan hydrolase-like protein with peptidoglycan-binding domain